MGLTTFLPSQLEGDWVKAVVRPQKMPFKGEKQLEGIIERFISHITIYIDKVVSF